MNMIGRNLLVVFVLLAMLSGCAVTSVRQHPDFASGKRKVNVVAILPSEVEYRHLVFTGENERDADKEKSIASVIDLGMSAILEKLGYTAKLDVVEKARSGDKEFNFQLEQLKTAYVQVAKELYAQPMVQAEQADKFKVSVGPLANPFATLSGADALLLARYQGFDKSGGLITKEIVGSALLAALTGSYYIPAKNGGQIELSLIDGISGDILWSNASGGPVAAYVSLANATAKLPAVPGAGGNKSIAAKADETKAPIVATEVTLETAKIETTPTKTPSNKAEITNLPTTPEKTP